MLQPKPALDVASLFAALGDGTRLELIARLGKGHPRSITQLNQGLGLTRQGVTKHLNVLKKAGLVSSTRSGRETHFRIEPDQLMQAKDYLARASAQWDDAIDRLKRSVDD